MQDCKRSFVLPPLKALHPLHPSFALLGLPRYNMGPLLLPAHVLLPRQFRGPHSAAALSLPAPLYTWRGGSALPSCMPPSHPCALAHEAAGVLLAEEAARWQGEKAAVAIIRRQLEVFSIVPFPAGFHWHQACCSRIGKVGPYLFVCLLIRSRMFLLFVLIQQ